MKKYLLFSILGIIVSSCSFKTEVLVVGTIHNGHASNPNYSFENVVEIIDAFDPDAICVEIRPQDFRKVQYLREMMLATIYGIENDITVYPIDWWEDGKNIRKERAEYSKTDEYKQKNEVFEQKLADSEIIQAFNSKYGELDSLWRDNNCDYEFINGRDYNDFIRERYLLSVEVFGDGLVNLFSEKRNAIMMDLINEAIEQNKGGRIIILTGAEHKYYFDDALSVREDIELVNIENVLPLKHGEFGKRITDYLELNIAKDYFDKNFPEYNVDNVYSSALIPIVHGRNMDFTPEIIPSENIKKAEKIIAKWKKENTNSSLLNFEKAWIEFLKGNYSKSIELLEPLKEEVALLEDDKKMIKVLYYRNLCISYSLLGNEKLAHKTYLEGVKIAQKYGLNKSMINNALYKSYKSK